MSEFKAITTQEEFEMRLKERLEQKERNVLKNSRDILRRKIWKLSKVIIKVRLIH